MTQFPDPPESVPAPSPIESSHITLYVACVVGLAVVAVTAVLTIYLVRPEQDNSKILTTVGTIIGPIIAALLALLARSSLQSVQQAVQQVHIAVNSRLSELVALTAKASHAQGQLEGQAVSGQALDVAASLAAQKVREAAAAAVQLIAETAKAAGGLGEVERVATSPALEDAATRAAVTVQGAQETALQLVRSAEAAAKTKL